MNFENYGISPYVRPVVPFMDFGLAVQSGSVPGLDVVNKFGRNPDVDTGSVPEDVWNGGSVYPGFPIGAPEEFQFLSDSALDTGTITFIYLASFDSTEWQTATVTLNGLTPVNSGISGVRLHTAFYSNASSTTFNAGTIIARHATTTANVFIHIPPGRSQSNACAYTVPKDHTGFIVRMTARVIEQGVGNIDGSIWVRERNKSPRLRRPFACSNSESVLDQPVGGIGIPALADVTIRVLNTSDNNVAVSAGFDIIVVKNSNLGL